MSIVTAVRSSQSITIAADTLAVFGEGMIVPTQNARTSKLMPIGNAIVGDTGWAVYDDIIDHWMTEKEPPTLDSKTSVFGFFP
mgnify:CR=1 FL=1